MKLTGALSRLALATAPCVFAAPAIAQPSGPRAPLVEEVRLSGVDEEFSTIDPNFVHVASDGRMLIWDASTSQVLIFSAAGKRIATFGRRGQGPGEFGRTVTGGWLADTLWIYDVGLRRFTLVGPDNSLLRVQPFQPAAQHAQAAATTLGGPMVRVTPVSLYHDGMLASVLVRGPQAQGGPSGRPLPSRYVVLSGSGELMRVVGVPPENGAAIRAPIRPAAAPAGAVTFVGATLPGGGTPPRAETAVAPHGRRFAFVETNLKRGGGGTFALTVLRPTGDTVFARTYAFDRIPMSKRVEDSIVVSLAPELRDSARTRMNGQFSPVTAVVLGLDDSIWLQTHETAAGVPCTMLDDRGQPVLTVVLPRRTELVQAKRGMVWAVQRNTDDVPSVVRYRVAMPGR
ncbi:MAG TPA: 6-bladed beta-propeller [Gemmatimonadaceae bacterium]|jgi:hypothetical protein|nr:6-bladed beta-propeller [Gemmatimonadaceae bacterium]